MHRFGLLLALLVYLGAATAGAQGFRALPAGRAGGITRPSSSFVGHSGFSRRGDHFRRPLRGAQFPPAIFVSDYGDAAFDEAPPVLVVEQPSSTFPPQPLRPVSGGSSELQKSPGAKLTELRPSAGPNTAGADRPSTAVFLLLNGQRIEADRYTITDRYVYAVTGRNESRRILLDDVNLEATVAINRRTGLELRIPSTHSELFLSY